MTAGAATVGTDAELAATVAEEAGALLVGLRQSKGHGGGEADASLGQAGDAGANELILERLAGARPGDEVLSEEARDDGRRLSADRVWIVDPLDGTREYSEGRADWAVHVALWERGQEITSAAVAMPDLDRVFRSDRPEPGVVPDRPLRVVVSRSRAPALATAVAEALGGELVPMGSAGAKAMAVLTGEVDVYLHAGGQWEWDSAAPVGVVRGAGLHASRLDGSPLRYNQPDPYLPDLVVCRADLAASVLAAVAAAS
jgi:3'(2'), 5'-bisphosphate nucleotidase